MVRYLVLLVDGSIAMHEKDFDPSRLKVTEEIGADFINEYFDQNPLSHISVIISRDSVAEKLTELGGNPKSHIQALRKNLDKGRGNCSFQNGLELSYKTLLYF
jgi:transcription initiation factor TFIIH subunit 2